MTRFRGKTAVVTGGASGIGESIVRLLVEEEASVVVADLQAELGQALAADLGDSVRFVRADVANESDVAAAIEAAVEAFGRLDVMCNNAGIVGPDPSIVDVTVDDYQRTLGVLLLGVILGTKHAARAMIRQDAGGAIVNTASIASVQGGLGPHLYTTAKHAVVGLTRSTASSGMRERAISSMLVDLSTSVSRFWWFSSGRESEPSPQPMSSTLAGIFSCVNARIVSARILMLNATFRRYH